jgi:hypothetical protein
MTTLGRYARRIVTATLLIATSAAAQGSTKSTQGATKSKQGSAKSAPVAAKSEPPKALQTRVWVNKDTKVYHCPGSIYYGKTRNGEFMEEAQARGYGNRAVEGQGCKNVVTNGRAPLPMATNAALRMVWVNTESGVYHCPYSAEWGATKRGRYLSESDASVSGHKPANGKTCRAR